MTMLVVTHEMGFAREVSDRVLFLTKGWFWRKVRQKNCLHILRMNGQKYFCLWYYKILPLCGSIFNFRTPSPSLRCSARAGHPVPAQAAHLRRDIL